MDRQGSRNAARVVPSRSPAAKARVRAVPLAHEHCRHLTIQVLGENLLDPVAHRALIPVHVENVMAPGVHDTTGDFRLAPRGIDRHRRSLELQHVQQFGDRRDLVALRIRHQLPEV